MSWNAYTYEAVVARIVDGDTIVVNVDLGFDVSHKTYVRLARINAPEMSTTEGVVARSALYAKLGAGPVYPQVRIKSSKNGYDRYHRWLAEVWLGEENVNDWMVKNGYAEAAA